MAAAAEARTKTYLCPDLTANLETCVHLLQEMEGSKSSDHLVNFSTDRPDRESRDTSFSTERETSLASSSPPISPSVRSSLSERRRSSSTVSPKKKIQLSLDEGTGAWRAIPKKNKANATSIRSRIKAFDWASLVGRGDERPPDCNLKIFVSILFAVIVFTIVYVSYYYKNVQVLSSISAQIFFWDEERQFDLLNADGNVILKAEFGLNVPGDIPPNKCISIDKDGGYSDICRDWKYRVHLDLNYEKKANGVSCYHVHWQGYSSELHLKDCFDLKDAFWYGMGQTRDLRWPLNGWSQESAPFVTSHDTSAAHPFGSIIKRYWISSNGVSIRVPLNVPLFVSFNSTASDPVGNGKLCLEAKTNRYPYDSVDGTLPHLDYSLCSGHDMLSLQKEMARNWTKKSETEEHKTLPHAVFLEKLIWTTKTDVVTNLTQDSVKAYADRIMEYGFEPGLMLLDSRWEKRIGDLSPNETDFPDATSLYSVLHNKGFLVLLTVTPFIDINADILDQASRERRVIGDPHLNVPLLTRCGADLEQMCALVDMMNATTREWFRKRIKTNIVKNSKEVDGFLFSGAQTSLMPHHMHSFQHNVINPDYFQMYYKNVAKHTSHLVGMDTAVGVQRLLGFYRLMSQTSSWDSLRRIIPSVLSMGIIGYPVVNAGSVGGDIGLSGTFEKELYIRWLELAAFLPILQFTEPPRNDLVVLRVAKKLLKVREEQVVPILLQALEETREAGTPLIRPLWFLPTEDEDSYQIDDQFTVSDQMIVAPVLEEGKRERDIYLPIGWWRDELQAQIVRGGKWIRNYPVDLDKVPYFTRTEQPS